MLDICHMVISVLMRLVLDAVFCRKDRNFDAGRPCTNLREVLHNDDNKLVKSPAVISC